MVYIPNDWVKHKENESKIHEILSELNNDILIGNIENKIKIAMDKLEALDETIVIEKLKNNEIPLGA